MVIYNFEKKHKTHFHNNIELIILYIIFFQVDVFIVNKAFHCWSLL